VNASAIWHDITLKVDQVSTSQQGTGMRVQMTFPEDFSAVSPNDMVYDGQPGKYLSENKLSSSF
jgi:hypothetical protein